MSVTVKELNPSRRLGSVSLLPTSVTAGYRLLYTLLRRMTFQIWPRPCSDKISTRMLQPIQAAQRLITQLLWEISKCASFCYSMEPTLTPHLISTAGNLCIMPPSWSTKTSLGSC